MQLLENQRPCSFPIFSSPSLPLPLSPSPLPPFPPKYNMQHLKDYLDLSESALRYMMRCYPEEKDEEQMRRALGRYGLTGKQQVQRISSKHFGLHFTSIRPESINSISYIAGILLLAHDSTMKLNPCPCSHSGLARRTACACLCGHLKCNLLLAQVRPRMMQHLSSYSIIAESDVSCP